MCETKFYKCYSANQKNWIVSNGLNFISSGINPKTNNRYWLFIKGRVLQMLLDEYKEGLNKK